MHALVAVGHTLEITILKIQCPYLFHRVLFLHKYAEVRKFAEVRKYTLHIFMEVHKCIQKSFFGT